MRVISKSCRMFRPTAIALAIAAAQCLLANAAYAQNPQPPQEYHLQRAPLDQTLLLIAKKSGVLISYDPTLVNSLQSSPVNGKFSPVGAIEQALQGTGLELVTTAGGQLTLRRSSQAKVKSAKPTKKPASSAALPEAELPLISVAAQRDSGGTGFVADSSSTFTRTDTPLSETPKSVSVINAAVIQSQSDTSLSEILRNASGVVTRPGPYGVPSYNVRGYAGAPVMSNGLSTQSIDAGPTLTPSIAIASVEVVKGPSAILAGDAPPGGVINIVKKMPQAKPFHEIQAGVGMYGYQQLAFDSTGAITQDKKLRYRFIVSGDKAGQTAMGYDGRRDFYFAPTLQWKDSSTDFTIGYSRTVARQPFPQYTVGFAKGGFIPGYLGYPLGSKEDAFPVKTDEVEAKLEQKFGQYVAFVSHAAYSRSDQLQDGWASVTPISNSNSLTLLGFYSRSIYYNLSMQNYLRVKTSVGRFKSTTLVGMDYSRYRYTQFDTNDFNIFTIPNVFVPAEVPPLNDSLYNDIRGETTNVGLYLQEQANYGRFHILGSLRQDNNLTDALVTGMPPYPGSHQRAVSPSLGVMYQLTSDVAAYVSYNGGFVPGTATTFTGALLPPQRSKQVEAGFKFNLLNDRLFVTTSVYRIGYSNQNVSDPVHRGFSLPAGGAVSRGAEIEVQGQVLPGLNVTAQYAYNNYRQDYNPALKVNLPRNTASMWATYNFQSPNLRGFGVGLGLFFASDQSVGNQGLYNLPSQLETDVGLFYRKKKYGLNLSVKNIFNRNLYYSSVNSTFIPMGPSRTVMLTGTYDF
ncbi:tonB-denpendent receptor [Pandoraea thiooxydans]|uniref:TonB-dependent receptor n=2 Tax=Pandoraea thiooxydans TaxID=445709 RepID=A0A0G3EMR0_9BURK|nr:TonB-dependent receptor [Pandoraea thiooxydans]APR94300.1 tonB-denpendent receptor [Pandoraea thiooxydans]